MTRQQGVPEHIAQRKEAERLNFAHNLAQRILSSVNRSAMGDQTLAWLKNVNENVPNLPAASSSSEAPSGGLTAVNILDRLFDDFERYSFHFNQTEPDRNYVISCIRPSIKRDDELGERYLGSLHNSFWTIIMVGQAQSIRATFMAARFAYEKEALRPAYTPFFELTGEALHGHMIWKLNNKSVSYSDLSYLSKMIFARLNRLSRGEVTESEPLFPAVQQPSDSSQSVPELIPAGEPEPYYATDTIGNGLIMMLEAIDDEMATLDREGLKALRIQGVQGVLKFSQRAEELKHFRAKLAELATEWANSLATGRAE